VVRQEKRLGERSPTCLQRGRLGRQGGLHGRDRLLLHGNRFLDGWFRIGRLGAFWRGPAPNRQQELEMKSAISSKNTLEVYRISPI